MEFEYDPEIIREIAELLVAGDCAAVRYQRAGIEWYASVYAECFLDEIASEWEEVRGNAPGWDGLSTIQKHWLLATIALCHESADQAYFEDEWKPRIACVIEEDIDPNVITAWR